jgi:hypothetical protein
MSQDASKRNAWDQLASWIFTIAGDLRYGKVEITIHDACVVQLEVTEKFRSPTESQSVTRSGTRPASR